MKKIVFIRLDKIGDLICTLPVDQVLDTTVYQVTWVVQKGMGVIVNLGEKKRSYIEIDKNNPTESKKVLTDFLQKNQFDIAVSFQAPWWVNYILFKAKIKKRIGVLSQWHSFLFFNHGIRQKRSQSTQHEFDYNLDLVKKITGALPKENQDIFFQIKKPNSSEVLEKFNLQQKQYIVVHPGMMGSALNWPQENYIKYIYSQILKNKTVVVTGTEADTPYLLKIKSEFNSNPQVIWLQSLLTLEELVQILYYSEKVVAPSTGVAHLASSLGKTVYGIYSPVRVHHPVRWAPRGPQVHIYVPQIKCPAFHNCLEKKCSYFNCMDKIQIDN